MENLPLLAPLAILIPAVGVLINFFWGARLGERWSGLIGVSAAVFSFIVSLVMFSYLGSSHAEAVIINPPFLDGWLRIESIGLEIPWQLRVDSLSVVMMLVVTGVGSLIHIYAIGYMHGDEKFPRFFAYLNLFLFFMLILVMGNNFLVMFVGWEGVGLCSYLLIGFWWDKKAPEGWKNSNAARKAFIVNRIGDFGMLMAIFLIFVTFGTLNFFGPTEVPNLDLAAEQAEEAEAEALGEAAADRPTVVVGEEGEHGDEVAAEDEHGDEAAAEDDHGDEAAAAGEHGEEDAHGDDEHGEAHVVYTDNNHIIDKLGYSGLGVFNQADAFLNLQADDPDTEVDEGETLFYGYDRSGTTIERGRMVDVPGLGELDIETVVVLITLFLLLGATGKSAQIPLFVWLPDAMAGPTPVSALIHAATMVTAGVYMMVRSSVMFQHAELTSLIVTLIGAGTAVVAGYIALAQWDIKKVLAYSTISQLGFMVAAVGVGAYVAAIFHLVTHACFKALLFLGSGSVIHGVEHGHHHVHEHGHGDDDHHDDDFDPQDMRNMGGLRRKMPITYWTYIIGALALAGIPPLAGFWSKDEILAGSWHAGWFGAKLHGYLALGLLLGAAFFTAFYMWRQIEMVFHGEPRTEAAAQAPESTRSMTIPLMVLAFLTLIVGYINVPTGAPIVDGLFKSHELDHLLEYSLVSVSRGPYLIFEWWLAGLATLVGLGGIFLAYTVYHRRPVIDNQDPLERRPEFRAIWKPANARLWWDEFYFTYVENPFNKIGEFLADKLDWEFLHDYFHDSVIGRGFNVMGDILANGIDLGIIDAVVNGVGRVTQLFSGRLRGVQTGYVRTYAVALLLGVVAVLIIMLLPLLQNG